MTTKDFETLLNNYTRAVSIHAPNRIELKNLILKAFREQQKPIEVKRLKWKKTKIMRDGKYIERYKSETPFGEYEILVFCWGFKLFDKSSIEGGIIHNTLKDAKAKAQEDFNKKLLNYIKL